MRGPFRRTRDGISIRLGRRDVEFLSMLPAMLDEVGSQPDDPAAERLAVPVYLDDPDSDHEYWRWMRPELDAGRSADRSAFAELVSAAAGGVVASQEEAEAFLRVLVEGRLALAARVGVQVEDDYARLAEDEEAILDYLASLQVLLIRELERA